MEHPRLKSDFAEGNEIIGILVRRTPEGVAYNVDQIATNSSRYHIGKTVSAGRDFDTIRRAFPSMKLVQKNPAPVPSLYDSVDDGIAFEFDAHSICKTIIVHRCGSPVSTHVP